MDYSAFPYNCTKCSHMIVCKHHEKVNALEEIKEILGEILVHLEGHN